MLTHGGSSCALVLNSMANKKKTLKPGDEGFLTAAAQAIGSTLGQIAVKTGVVTAPPAARKKATPKKAAVKKAPAKKAPAKKKTVAAKKKAPAKRK
jgi:NADPH-dependent curcumin reductase CurA